MKEFSELLYDMKDHLDEKYWDNVFRKAIKRTKIKEKDTALKDLQELIA